MLSTIGDPVLRCRSLQGHFTSQPHLTHKETSVRRGYRSHRARWQNASAIVSLVPLLSVLPYPPPVAPLAQNTLPGQRMSLAFSLLWYLRTPGSEPGVLHRVSPSFQLNRFGPSETLPSSQPGSVPRSLLISSPFPGGLVSTMTG